MGTPTQQDIATGIYGALSGDTGAGGINTLTSGRIYEGVARQDSEMPFVVYEITWDPPAEYFSGSTDISARVEIDVYSPMISGPAAARAIADRLHALLHMSSITVTNHVGAQMWSQDRGHVEELDGCWHVGQDYKLLATET